jgi:peroxiredoxin
MLNQKQQTVNRGLVIALVGVAAAVGIGYLATLSVGNLAVDTRSVQPVDVSNLEIAPVEGALAPNFTLQDLNGEQFTLSELRGHPILINLWATWCAPCRIEMPHIQDRFERYADQGFLVLAVDFDEPADQVAAFRDELGLTFDILLDPGGEIQELYRNRSYPSSFFVDENGVIQVQHIGIMTEGQLDENLSAIGLSS